MMKCVDEKFFKIAIIGTGSMGAALTKGISLAAKNEFPIGFYLNNRNSEKALKLKNELEAMEGSEGDRLRIFVVEKLSALVLEKPDMLIIAVKPKDIKELLKDLVGLDKSCIISSVLAGISVKIIEEYFPANPIIRAMPNTPAQINQGVTAIFANLRSTPEHVSLVKKLFSTTGKIILISDESKMHAVTAVSGSGPAYFLYFVEALKKAALALGLNDIEAEILVQETFFGTASLLNSSGKTPEDLRAAVTSPKGTTEAGISFLEKNGFDVLIAKAIAAAEQRSIDISST